RRRAPARTRAPARAQSGGSGSGARWHKGAGEAAGGDGTEPQQRLGRRRRPDAGCEGEYAVAVERRVERPDGTGEPTLRHDRQAAAAALVKGGIGGDDGDCRVAGDGVTAARRKILGIERRIGGRWLWLQLARRA